MELKDHAFIKKIRTLREKLRGKTLVLVIMAFGALLLLISAWSGGGSESGKTEASPVPEFSLEEAEKRLAGALQKIDGAGKVEVVLTLRAGAEAELAADEDANSGVETVIVSTGSGTEGPVIRRYLYPEYQGALIIAQGGGGAETRLRLTRAVSSLTGLGSDRITVLKMQEGR